MKLILLEMVVIVWKPSGGHLYLHNKVLFFSSVVYQGAVAQSLLKFWYGEPRKTQNSKTLSFT